MPEKITTETLEALSIEELFLMLPNSIQQTKKERCNCGACHEKITTYQFSFMIMTSCDVNNNLKNEYYVRYENFNHVLISSLHQTTVKEAIIELIQELIKAGYEKELFPASR